MPATTTPAPTTAYFALSAPARAAVERHQADLKYLADCGYRISQQGLAGHIAYYGKLAA